MEATNNLDFSILSSASASQCPPCARRGWQGFSQEVTGLAGGSPGVLSHCVDAQSPRGQALRGEQADSVSRQRCPGSPPNTEGRAGGLSTTASRPVQDKEQVIAAVTRGCDEWCDLCGMRGDPYSEASCRWPRWAEKPSAWAMVWSRGGAWPQVVSLSDEVQPLLG